MNLTLQDLQREAAATGFPAETLEKVIRLVGLLNAFRSHPYLESRVALKGGTALNLFVFDVPRLSVDIDLNYVGAADRETMLAEKPRIEEAVEAVCRRERLVVKRVPAEHAGGKWRLGYTAASGQGGNIEVDVNFMLRTPLWPVRLLDSRPIASFQATRIPVLDLHEVAADKLAALLARNASRDVFDAHALLARRDLDLTKLRLAFVVYGGANRRDWRTVSIDDVRVDPVEMNRQLVPTLRVGTFHGAQEAAAWAERLVSECRNLLSLVLPLEPNEVEFIERLNDHGEIVPGLLTGDAAMQALIRRHPALLWKAINVRRHRGSGAGPDPSD